MLFPAAAVILASAGLIEARGIAHRHADMHIAKRATATSSGDSSLTLSANAIQSGSFVDGSKEIGAAEVGQALSETSTNNFINYCAGKTLTNGLQILTGSCNGIPMGDIPAKTAMVSSIITFPQYGSSSIQSDTTFNITVQMSNIVTGSFTNADATYYAAPQQLSGGKVVGHTHVTVQDMGNSLNPTTPLDPTQFAFFKGINTAADSNGVLTATVTGGLPAGNYRLCTLASSSNHQPVLMPVAQRGTADDCTKFVVSGSGTTANAASNNGSGGQAAAAAAASAVAAGPGAIQSSAASSSSTSQANAKVSTSAKASAATKATTTKATTSSAKAAVATTSSSSKATSVTLSSAGSSASATSKGSKSKGSKNVSGSTQVISITVIEYITFFNFAASKGGVCPSVNKNGESAFEVLGEQFADLASAAAAACGHQFTSCQSFAGPLFSVEECVTQQDSCSSAASSATTTAAAPTTLTASITAAATQTVSISSQSGVSVLSTVTSSTTVSIAAAASTTALAVADSAATGACSIVTGTVTVDAVAAVATSSSSSSTLSSASSKATGFNFSNSTASATSSSASAKASVSTNSAASSTALGGISAPAITNSGDASRPFLVNGNTFVNEAAALQRSCDIQFNQCANAVNGGTASGFTLSDCSAQQTTCNAA